MHAICGGTVGVITANASRLTPRHFAACYVAESVPLVVAGMEGKKEFREAILEERGTLDSSALEKEVIAVALQMMEENPGIRSILLECSDLPPYAHAVQAATGRPIFDFITMIDYVQQTIARRPYYGRM